MGPTLQTRFRTRPQQRVSARHVALAASVAGAWVAQHWLDDRQFVAEALLLYGASIVAAAVACRSIAVESPTEPADPVARLSPRVVLALSALSLVGCLGFGGNRIRPVAAVLWLGGIGLLAAYAWASAPAAPARRRAWAPYVWLGLILVVGAWLRLVRLHEIPADMGWDLPYNLFDTAAILRGEYRIFFPENLGREGLFFYCAAAAARLLGLSQWTLQFTSAAIGIVTIAAVAALGREMFNREVGLLAAALLAVNRWHIVLSRSGYRVILMPLFAILVLLAVTRALRRRRPVEFVGAGLALGWGFYTYKSFAFALVAVVVGLLLYALAHRGGLRALGGYTLLAILAALLAVAPMARFVAEFPDQYLAREKRQLTVLNNAAAGPGAGLVGHYQRTLLGFHLEGDSNSRFNVPFARHMGFVSGVCMALGLGWAVARWRQGHNALLLAALFVLVLPTAVSMLPGEPPNLFRMSGAIGPAVLLAALPLHLALATAPRTWPALDHASVAALRVAWRLGAGQRHWAGERRLKAGTGLRLALVLLVGYALLGEMRETRRFYFHDYVAVLPDQANYSLAREMAREIAAYGDRESAYIKIWPHWYDGNAVRASLGVTDRRWNLELLEFDASQPPLALVEDTALVIVHPGDQTALQALEAAFPRGVCLTRRFPNGAPSFLAFYVQR